MTSRRNALTTIGTASVTATLLTCLAGCGGAKFFGYSDMTGGVQRPTDTQISADASSGTPPVGTPVVPPAAIPTPIPTPLPVNGQAQSTLGPPFITRWQTEWPQNRVDFAKSLAMSSDREIRMPVPHAPSGSIEIHWGDGSISRSGGSDLMWRHVYADKGTYEVRIYGNIGSWECNAECEKLTEIKAWGQFKLGAYAFIYASSMTISATDAPNLSGVKDLRAAFWSCESVVTVPGMENWDVSNVTDLSRMFFGASRFNHDIASWNTAAATDMSWMFYNAAAFNQNIGRWNTGRVTDMTGMFWGATAFNHSIGSWNTGRVTRMTQMFVSAVAFNQNIGAWNTAAVTGMGMMFNNAQAFNQDIGSWNTGSVTDMSWMFSQARAFNQNIGRWNTGRVTGMTGMFYLASAFNQDIGGWNTSAVTNMSKMFWEATVFNQDIGRWDTGAVTIMDRMFKSATGFNQNIGGWNTASVAQFCHMFDGASSFDQDLSRWNIVGVKGGNQETCYQSPSYGPQGFGRMFTGTALSSANYGKILVGWSGQSNLPTNVGFFADAKYPVSAEAARQALMAAPRSWIITDGGREP